MIINPTTGRTVEVGVVFKNERVRTSALAHLREVLVNDRKTCGDLFKIGTRARLVESRK
jgi:hypothetical protein